MTISKIKTGSIDTAYTTAITTNPQFSGTESVKFPGGSTAQRPASAVIGQMRYNSDSGYFETYTSAGWGSIATPPSITTVSPATFNGETSTLFTINGSFFDPSATVKFITTSGSEYTAATVSYNNSGQLTATTPRDFTVADEPLSVKVINGSGLAFVLSSCIDCGGVPAWSTAAGSLASVAGNSSVNTSVTAIDPDSNATVSYSLSSGALPTGVSLNASTGAITGSVSYLSAATASTTSNFTLLATDNAGNSTSRSFSITVTNNAPSWTTASGSLGTIEETSSGSFTVAATDPEGGSVTYSVTSGSLPTGMSLNASTGVISGTPSTSQVGTISFTITATDAANQTTARAFSIEVTALVYNGSTASRAAVSGMALKALNLGDGWYYIKPTGQSTAYRMYVDNTRNGGGWVLTATVKQSDCVEHFTTSSVRFDGTNGPSTGAANTYKMDDSWMQSLRSSSSYSGSTAFWLEGNFTNTGVGWKHTFVSTSATINLGDRANLDNNRTMLSETYQGALTDTSPNDGTKGLGDHHTDTRFFAWSRHPEQGCSSPGMNSDAFGAASTGYLWIK